MAEPEREMTAWELVAAGIEEDGTVPKEVALQAFALTLADIPGVTPPAADELGHPCGSIALRWVTRHADALTGEERAAIEEALGASGKSESGAARLAQFGDDGDQSCTVGEAVSQDGEGAEAYRPILEQELSKLEQALGRSLGIPVYLTLGLGKSGKTTLAWASPQSSTDCATGPATSCRVEILVNRAELADEAQLRSTLSHELVHCFQATYMPVLEALNKPEWLVEGFPDYAGESLNPTAPRVSFLAYSQTPLRRLYHRTYDAQGFFFHLHTIGADVFGRYEAAFKTASSSAAFAHLIEPWESAFGNTWASSFALDPTRGDAWYMPEAPPEASVSFAGTATVRNCSSYMSNPGEAGTRISHVDFEADILVFEIGGAMNGRISWDDGGESLLSEMDGQEFCVRAGGCECPPESPGSPPQTPIPSVGAIVSTTGTTATTTIEIRGVSLENYCRGEPDSDECFDPCIVGTWESDTWTLPGPVPEMDGTGGDGATVTIRSDGSTQWNFSAMQPITIYDEQIDVTTELYSRGSASARIGSSGGKWTVHDRDISAMEGFAIDNIIGEYPLAGGPGLMVLLTEGSYTCSGSVLSYTTTDPVEGDAINITLRKK